MLKYDNKKGNIRLIDIGISMFCFYFEGTKQYNYASEML